MPLYEYTCRKCHENQEVMQKFSDPPLKKCPACGGRLVKKLSATAFQLKGGGWYKDGYSSGATKKEETKTPSDTKAKSEGEAKPAAKSSDKKGNP